MSVPLGVFVRRDLTSLIAFPLWWYGDGLFGVLTWMRESLQAEWRALGIGLWMRSFFQPMYGVTDLPGRVISVVARLFVILGRSAWWLIQAVIYAVGVVVWCLWIPLSIALLFV
jgi:hypothetical protein